MDLITLDFETYYDSEYSLSKMNTEEYVRDPRFEALMVGIKRNDGEAQAFVGEEMIRFGLDAAQLENHAVIMHHAHFDAAILNWKYGVRPKIILDTLSMGRACVGSAAALGGSLASLAAHFGIGTKGTTYMDMKGKRLSDMTEAERSAYARYCAIDHDSDVNLTHRLYNVMKPGFTPLDLKLIDVTIRMFTEPLLEMDGPLYLEFKNQEIARKATLILQAGVAKEDLMSNDKFAEVLKRLGVKPPMKWSPKKKDENGKPVATWAFAKTDDGLKDLLEHDNELVRTVVEARMGVKTSINETRAQRFADMAARGAAPIYLKYWGAEQTGRHAAGDKTNMLNLGRSKMLTPDHLVQSATVVTPAGMALVARLSRDGQVLLTTLGEFKVKDCHQLGLRDGLRAPPGYKIVVCDSSNIEARGVCYIAGQEDVLEIYREGGDPYCDLAGDIFRRVITKAENPAERQMGKVGVLQLGFQSGKDTFFDTVRGWDFGPDAEIMRPYQQDESLIRGVVDVFRNKYYNVKWTWEDYLNRVIPALSGRECVYLDRKGLMQTTERGTILLPNGRELRYPKLRWKEYTHEEQAQGYGRYRSGEWVFDVRDGKRIITTRLYGGKLFENVVQAFCTGCGGITMEQAVQVAKRYRLVHVGYDEAICCVREELAEECEAYMKQVFTIAPSWAPDFPVAAETGIGDFYGAAKS